MDPAEPLVLPATVSWVVVDVMNVVGSRPDGWWRDREGAVARLVAALARHVAGSRRTTAVVDLDRSPIVEEAAGEAVELVFAGTARDAADDAIVALLRERPTTASTAVVVTADRRLRERVTALGARVVGPRSVRAVLDGGAGDP